MPHHHCHCPPARHCHTYTPPPPLTMFIHPALLPGSSSFFTSSSSDSDDGARTQPLQVLVDDADGGSAPRAHAQARRRLIPRGTYASSIPLESSETFDLLVYLQLALVWLTLFLGGAGRPWLSSCSSSAPSSRGSSSTGASSDSSGHNQRASDVDGSSLCKYKHRCRN